MTIEDTVNGIEGLHISSFIQQHNSSARAINRYGYLLADDWYSNNIRESAAEMIAQSKSSWVYSTQYSSGNCCWRSPDNERGMIVNLN